jgi:hypothetical protein
MTKKRIGGLIAMAMVSALLTLFSLPQSASAAESTSPEGAAACAEWGPEPTGIYTGGNPDNQRWGWVYTVHSAACNHWGSVALHAPLPRNHQVNVTLTRYNGNVVADHRYCYIRAGESNCHTPAILTTSCQWWYKTTADVYRWNGTSWIRIAWGSTNRSGSC